MQRHFDADRQPVQHIWLFNAQRMRLNCGGAGPHNGCGTVFQLTPTPSGWTANIIYTFTDGEDGKFPISGLVADQAGNLYGVSSTDGPEAGGTVFELSPSDGSWTYHAIYALPNGYPQEGNCFIAVGTYGCSGPWGTLLIDSAGNLYGASYANGAYHYGNVFKLTRSNGSWAYTDLYDFTGGSDGGGPMGSVDPRRQWEPLRDRRSRRQLKLLHGLRRCF